MNRVATQLQQIGSAAADLIRRIPLQNRPPLPPDWLRVEMVERLAVLQRARIAPGATVVEIGSGPHAISTVPLAFVVGARGRVIAVERSRWGHFREIVAASGLAGSVRPIAGEARRLPLRADAADLSVCVHGIRSLGAPAHLVTVLREMLRISPRLFLAESLPLARNAAQRAHLEMYDLRHEVFKATSGRSDDLPHLPLETLVALVEEAGGAVEMSSPLEIDLPDAFAYFPRSLVEEIPDAPTRASLLARWDEARSKGLRHGTDHPPVGTLTATRR